MEKWTFDKRNTIKKPRKIKKKKIKQDTVLDFAEDSVCRKQRTKCTFTKIHGTIYEV